MHISLKYDNVVIVTIYFLQAPQPVKPWDGVRMAKTFGPICIQYDFFRKIIPANGSEDCLYLNVYTPELTPDKPLPVMFFIHGGGNVSGDGNDDFYGPEFLLRQDVILVTFNYRLEALGFLCLDTEEIPGNAGMKDQVAALRWVKNNISNFGGEPENITLFGESAGSANIAFHLVSPMTKGLFQRAILQSGTSNLSWTQPFEPRTRALAFARKLGLNSENDKDVLEFFKALPAESLVQLYIPITAAENVKFDGLGITGIVSENKFGDKERFFYGDTFDSIRSGIHEGVEVMVGYTQDEGVFMLSLAGLDKIIERLNNYIDSLVPLNIERNCSLKDQIEVSRSFKKYYFGNETPTVKKWENLAQYVSFNAFIFGIIQWTKICANRKKNDIYLYKFTCKTERNSFAQLLGLTNIIGDKKIVSHFDDIFYLFPAKILNQKIDQKSSTFELIEKITKLWTNFAKYGYVFPIYFRTFIP